MAQYLRKLTKGLRWYYKFDLRGKTYFSHAVYLSKSDAKKAENAKYDEVDNQADTPSEKPNLSLLQAMNERMDYVMTKMSHAYYRENKRYYSLLLESIGDVSIGSISKAQVSSLLLEMSQELQEQGKDNYAVNAVLRVYKALFQMMIKNHDLNIKNPCVGIDLYSINKRLKYIPTDKEIEAVKAKCDPEECLLIDFIMDTGARISETLRVMGKDIGEGFVILYTRKSKNSNLVPRKVPVHIQLPFLKSNERLFKRWTHIPRFIEKSVRKLEQQNWSHHNLRHRYASLLSKQGKPLFDIMSLLGHSNLETTQKYLQLL